MDVMEHAMSLSEKGPVRWQMKPLQDATESGAIAWVRVGFLKALFNRGGAYKDVKIFPHSVS